MLVAVLLLRLLFIRNSFCFTHICEQRACIPCSMFIVRTIVFLNCFDSIRSDSIRGTAFLRICLGVAYSSSMCCVHDFCGNACLCVCEEGKISPNIWIEYEENWKFVWANAFIFAHLIERKAVIVNCKPTWVHTRKLSHKDKNRPTAEA